MDFAVFNGYKTYSGVATMQAHLANIIGAVFAFQAHLQNAPQILPNGDGADGDENGAGADQDILQNPDADDEGNDGI